MQVIVAIIESRHNNIVITRFKIVLVAKDIYKVSYHLSRL